MANIYMIFIKSKILSQLSLSTFALYMVQRDVCYIWNVIMRIYDSSGMAWCYLYPSIYRTDTDLCRIHVTCWKYETFVHEAVI